MELGWLDFSKSERAKILSVLDLLSEPGTLDELGIAPIRDGFANLFFPGTSTIQTRAKYFFIVPYALKELELSNETNPNRILSALDAIEKLCGQKFLQQNPSENGIIGKRSLQNHGWVKRTPADIYWAGLKRYGIFVGGNISLSEYVRKACELKQQKSDLRNPGNRSDEAEEYSCDDKYAGNPDKKNFWNMPLFTLNWQTELNIQLNEQEGEYLKKQILLTCNGSMLSFFLENKTEAFLSCESFKALGDIIAEMPENIQNDYLLACAFSDFIYVIRAVYNVIVSEGKNDAANEALIFLTPNFEKIADIDIVYIMNRLELNSKNMLKDFLLQAQDSMRRQDIETLKALIISREIKIKGESRAKTKHPEQFSEENVWIGGGALDYRFSSAKMIIRDIFESQVSTNA